jgi:hypothetical protein
MAAASSGGGGGVTCAFPLDASQSEVQAFFDGKLTPSNDDQTGTYSVQSQLGSAEEYAMLEEGFTGGTSDNLDLSSGIVAVAFTCDQLPSIDASSTGSVVARFWFFTPAFSPDFLPGVEAKPGGTYTIYSDVELATGLAAPPKQVAVYFNADTGQYGVSTVYDDDSAEDFGYLASYSVGDLIAVLSAYEQPSIPAADAGETWQCTFVTSASEIDAPVPSGAVDPCGNTI